MLYTMGDDEGLEKLSRKGNERQQHHSTRAAKSADRDRARAEAEQRGLAIESLDRWARFRRVIILFACFGGLVAYATTREEKPAGLAAFATVGVMLVALAVGLFLAEKAAGLFAASELRKLRRLPYRFDVDAYRAALGTKRSTAQPRVTVQFTTSVADADRELVADAVQGAVKNAQASWSGDALHISTDPITTVFRPVRTRGGGAKSYHSNDRVHKWLRSVILRALAPIHRRAAIESISVELGA